MSVVNVKPLLSNCHEDEKYSTKKRLSTKTIKVVCFAAIRFTGRNIMLYNVFGLRVLAKH